MTPDPSTLAYERTLARWRADRAGRETRWTIAHGAALKCHACDGAIAGGDPYRQVTKQNWPFCRACAKSRFEEDPPADLVRRPVTAIKFRPPQTFEKLVDVRARQLGEREPGEDDVS